MGRCVKDIKNLCQKAGRLYVRRKVAGKDQYVRVPDISDPGFDEAYRLATQPVPGRQRAGRGTVAGLVHEYRASSEFRAIPSATTRTNYLRYLDMIETEHGHRSVVGVTPHHIYRMRDAMQDTPGKANNWLNVFKRLMAYATKHGLRRDDPSIKIPMLPLGEREPWPADVLARALEEATPMTRLAIITGLCSGARISDVIKMQHGWHDREIMTLKTQKKKKHVAIPMHPEWLAELDKHERRSVTLLYDRSGKPFTSTKALQERIRSLMKSIGAPEFTFHGLRKNAACYLVELGLTEETVGAILAMTPETVRYYAKQARTIVLARGAAELVTRGDVLLLKGGQRDVAAR